MDSELLGTLTELHPRPARRHEQRIRDAVNDNFGIELTEAKPSVSDLPTIRSERASDRCYPRRQLQAGLTTAPVS
jgi:hypothetical protein